LTSTSPSRRGRPPIALELIISTALEMIDAQGPDAFSFRALAQRLSSGTATLYRHVSDKSELFALVIEHVLSSVEVPELENSTWDEQCEALMRAIYDQLAAHPGVSTALVTHFPNDHHAASLRERLFTALLDGGFTADVAATGGATLARYTLGFAIQSGLELSSAPEAPTPDPTPVASQERHPATASLSHLLPKPLHEEFEFGMQLLLQGLNTKLREEKTTHEP